MCGFRARHVGGHGPEETVVDQEHEGCRALHHPGFDQPAPGREGFVAVVTRAGLASDDVPAAIPSLERSPQALGGALLHDLDESAAEHRRDLRGHDPFARRRGATQTRLVRGVGGEVEPIDQHGWRAEAAVHDDPHELAQSRGPVAGAADGRGEGRGHGREGIAQALPAAVDLEEGLRLQQAPDALVLGVAPLRIEQPAVDRLALSRAGAQDLGEPGRGVPAQVRHQPQLERMDPRDVAAVHEGECGRRVPAVQRFDDPLGDALRRQPGREDALEHILARIGIHRAKHGGQRLGRLTRGAQHEIERLLRGLVLVFAVEAPDELASLAIGEAGQVDLPERVVGVLQDARQGRGRLVEVVVHDVPHQADKHEVDGAAEALAHRKDPRVVIGVEVVKGLKPASGDEGLGGACRVATVHRRLQHGGESGTGRPREIVDRPGGEAILGVNRQGGERAGAGARVPLVQFRDGLEVCDQRAELRGRTQVEPRAGIDVQRLVEVVSLDPYHVGPRSALVEGEAVDHAGRVAPPQQVETLEPQRPDGGWLPQGLQDLGHRLLCGPVEGALRGQVEPVQIVEGRHAQQGREPRAHQVHPLALAEVGGRRRARRPEAKRLLQRRVAQAVVDDSRPGHDPQIAVGEVPQRLPVLVQIVVGTTGGQQQAQHLPVCLGAAAIRSRRDLRQQTVDLAEARPVPGPQPIAQAEELAVAGGGRERHRVEIVQHDPAPRGQRVSAVLVGAQARRQHLPQLFPRRSGTAFRRMTELLELSGQRACSEHLTLAAEPAEDVDAHRLREPVPLHGRVQLRPPRIQEIPVLDEEERPDDHGRDGLETLPDALGGAGLVEGAARSVRHAQPRLTLLAIDREQSPADQVAHPRRGTGLGVDRVAGGAQALEKVRQPAIAEARVIGSAGRSAEPGTRAGLELEVDPAVEPGQQEGLQMRHANLEERDQRQDEHQPGRDGEPQQPRPQVHLFSRGRPRASFDAFGGDGLREHWVHGIGS